MKGKSILALYHSKFRLSEGCVVAVLFSHLINAVYPGASCIGSTEDPAHKPGICTMYTPDGHLSNSSSFLVILVTLINGADIRPRAFKVTASLARNPFR